MTKYGKSAGTEVEKEMRRYKKGTAHSGKGLAKVKSREQAIAIGLSKARKKGGKVPKKTKGKTETSTKSRSKVKNTKARTTKVKTNRGKTTKGKTKRKATRSK